MPQPNKTTAAVEVAPETQQQYMCVSKLYLSDATQAFVLPADDTGKGNAIAVGEMLQKSVQNMFWLDAAAANAGRPMPIVTVGFASGTGVYHDPATKKNITQIRLQFQIFKPTGQSYMDAVNGQSVARSNGAADNEVAIRAAMTQALHRLQAILSQATICRSAE